MPVPAYQPVFDNFWCIPAEHVTNEQTFSAPGTWNCPSTTKWIEVITVGGGGGGGAGNQPPTPGFGGGGGGGAVRYSYIPVNGPISVTIGSGGVGAVGPINPATVATSGGATYLGPLGPIPTTTAYAGGGGAGGSYLLAPQPAPLFPLVNGTPASPSTFGGGGGAPALLHPNTPLANAPVQYGVGALGTPSNGTRKGGGAWRGGYNFTGNGRGFSGFGGGGGTATDPANPTGSLNNTLVDGAGIIGLTAGGGGDAVANTGGGGSGGGDTTASPPASPVAPINGGNGGSGFCIIRWKEVY